MAHWKFKNLSISPFTMRREVWEVQKISNSKLVSLGKVFGPLDFILSDMAMTFQPCDIIEAPGVAAIYRRPSGLLQS